MAAEAAMRVEMLRALEPGSSARHDLVDPVAVAFDADAAPILVRTSGHPVEGHACVPA